MVEKTGAMDDIAFAVRKQRVMGAYAQLTLFYPFHLGLQSVGIGSSTFSVDLSTLNNLSRNSLTDISQILSS